MNTLDSAEILQRARRARRVIPAFNIPYLPMMAPVIQAVRDLDCLAFVAVARLEWIKFEAGGPGPVHAEYQRCRDPKHTRLHLDHVPVIDEDGRRVDFLAVFREALDLGYDSVMIDGSRLPLEENIRHTRAAVETAHAAGVPCEAELGAVLGHEAGPLPPYEELFRSGRGFTDIEEARTFVRETRCDWLSIAAGNIHGAIAPGMKDRKKTAARLNLDHIANLAAATGVPLVLHGGSGIPSDYVAAAVQRGIAKINVGTDIRQPYERALQKHGIHAAIEAVYDQTVAVLERLPAARLAELTAAAAPRPPAPAKEDLPS